MRKVCLITGANRGIGFEIACKIAEQGHDVIVGARSMENATAATDQLKDAGLHAQALLIDVTDDHSVRAAAEDLEQRVDRLDVLINNAGIMRESLRQPSEATVAAFEAQLATNVVGPMRTIQAFLPLLRRSQDARIVNVSSDLGAMAQASDPESRYAAVLAPTYRASKAALNMLSLAFAKELQEEGIAVSVCSPGWCRTDLDDEINSTSAPFSPAEGADTAVWLAVQADRSQNGKFFAMRKSIAW
ncbi:SDR family oxidoreductase [Rhizorhapis suberifaciens]|uniref:NAD(P)-dependent dehydrogenase (Short-subunit alcohol dehydrogenase family) n=1 Tax=Rhizorhapis suberifaciens TaxID=13656 RepID=A0A840HS40_9SPHN|nr:SDR family oxidoreductase [Rhizorhapis suberifaciens]MBB4640733.1 NAD(P)-dependent dehydrogenase (short-subunit alcohol dehydrogenase family) [Rhizorhapis suberifaciens]